MARQDTGKWVTRAASTGGSRAYRGQRPVRWYLSLALICLLGVALVAYSRYERQHPSSTGQPAVGTKWFDAVGFDICGTVEPNLPANPVVKGQATPGITTDGDGVLHIAPLKSDQAGANATLGAFVAGYKGLVLTTTQVRYPGSRSAGATVGRTFGLGDTCPKGTKDAGQHGIVEVALWPTTATTTPTLVGDPPALKLGNEQELELAFLPKGVTPAKPVAGITSMLQDVASQSSSSSGSPVPTGSSVSSVPTGKSVSSGSTGKSGSSGSAGKSGSSGSAKSGSAGRRGSSG